MNHCPGPLELLADHLRQHPDQPYLHQPVERVWRSFTWREVDDQARRIASGLLAQGYAPGERIAILAKNCAEWFIVDLAIIMAGMVSVPIYTTAAAGTIRYVLEHSGARAIVLGKLDDTAAAEEAMPTESFLARCSTNSPSMAPLAALALSFAMSSDCIAALRSLAFSRSSAMSPRAKLPLVIVKGFTASS